MSERLRALTGWRCDWSGLRVAVDGLGWIGFAAADTLVELGAAVTVLAGEPDPELTRTLEVLGVPVHDPSGALPAVFDLAISTPEGEASEELRRSGVPVWGDLELAWRVRDKVLRRNGDAADWIFVAGGAGATATADLAASMMAAGGIRAAPCTDVPVLDALRDPAGFDVLVIEATPGRLARLPLSGPGAPSPYAGVCLYAPDPGDEPGAARVYQKARVACVYNKADAGTRRLVEEADVVDGARAIGFGRSVPGPSEVGMVDGVLCDRAFLDDRHHSALELTTLEELRAFGLAEAGALDSVLAASALARSYGTSPEAIRQGLHR